MRYFATISRSQFVPLVFIQIIGSGEMPPVAEDLHFGEKSGGNPTHQGLQFLGEDTDVAGDWLRRQTADLSLTYFGPLIF